MKSLFLIIVLCMSVSMKAQHFTFMGIPIDGSPDDFEQELVLRGFRRFEFVNNAEFPVYRWYKGIFAGYKSTLLVSSTKKSNTVYSVSVNVPVENDSLYINEICKFFQNTIEDKYSIDKKENTENGTRYVIGQGNIVVNVLTSEKESIVSVQYLDIDNAIEYNNEKRDDI